MKTPTQEEKERFFAQHWGQNILNYTNNTIHKIVDSNVLDPSRNNIKHAFLLLKPLSSITDEDARIMGFRDASHFAIDANPDGRKDELRMLGYAVDWLNYSVEDMVSFGWIKLTT